MEGKLSFLSISSSLIAYYTLFTKTMTWLNMRESNKSVNFLIFSLSSNFT